MKLKGHIKNKNTLYSISIKVSLLRRCYFSESLSSLYLLLLCKVDWSVN